jgi:hypothetical protein
LISVFKNDEIEFLCEPEDYGIIPEPYKANRNIPDWFKHLPPKLEHKGFKTSTLKRCMPFMDALCVGYIIPLAADVEFISNEDATGISYKWNFKKTMVQNHIQEQVTTEKSPNPFSPKPPMKFLNYWYIKTPPGYSLLFVPPLNRVENRFTCYSGIVDYPYYQHEYINFPFFFNQPNFSGIIPAGTPLMQVIPIRKDSLLPKHRSRSVNTKEKKESNRTRKIRDEVHESLYKDNIHRKL